MASSGRRITITNSPSFAIHPAGRVDALVKVKLSIQRRVLKPEVISKLSAHTLHLVLGMTKPSSRTLTFTLEDALRISSLILAMSWFFFVLGWAYLDAWYSSFGVDINILDLPTHYLIISSVIPIGKSSKILFYAATLSLILGVAWIFKDDAETCLDRLLLRVFGPGKPAPDLDVIAIGRQERIDKLTITLFRIPVTVAGLMATTTFAVAICFFVGRKDGLEYHQHPLSKVCLSIKKEDESVLADELVTANKNGSIRLLAQTKDLVLAFVSDHEGNATPGVFFISRSSLVSVASGRACK